MTNDPRFVENDIEQSYTYEKEGIRTDLSILGSAGSDPACISHTQYQDGELTLNEQLHLDHKEGQLLFDLLNRPNKFL